MIGKDKLIMEPQTVKIRDLLLKNIKRGNTENTIEFVRYLKGQRQGKRLAIFGDSANYYNSQEFPEYLMLINQDLPQEIMLHKLSAHLL